MTLRSLLRLLAGLALALFLAASWATPSEAHAGHDGPAAATEQVDTSATFKVAGVEGQQVAEAGSADCGGHANQNGSDAASCCGDACHAAMSSDVETLRAMPVAMTILPTLPAPPELSGPTAHIKRPPRPSAASVG